MPGPRIERGELELFAERYATNGFNFQAAAKSIGRDPKAVRRHLKTDEWFAEAFEEAKAEMRDAARAEIVRRAIDGVERNVYFQGVLLETVRDYSDSLLALMAKAILPEYREQSQIDVTTGGKPIDLSDQQIAAKLSAIIAAARHRRLTGEVVDAEVVEVKALPPGGELWD